jgi:hypothetical protein
MASAQHGFVGTNHILYQQGMTVGSGESRLPISREVSISDESSLYFTTHIDVENVVLGAGEEIKIWLQKLINEQWIDVGDPQATVPVDMGDGTYCIMLNTDLEIEAMVLPLPSLVRVAIDTGVSSSLKIVRVTVYDRV